jgi:hypothetical protein
MPSLQLYPHQMLAGPGLVIVYGGAGASDEVMQSPGEGNLAERYD